MDKSVSKIGSGLKDIGGGLSDIFTDIVEKVGRVALKFGEMGVAGAAAATAFGLKFNDELEQTQISIASIFSANGVANNMVDGMDQASKIMQQMRKDAQALPGTFQELTLMMKTMAIPGFQAGMSTERLEQLSAQSMAVAKVAGVSIPVAAREMATLMSGHATSANVMALRLGIIGDEAKKFRAMSPEERVTVLTHALEKYKGSIDTFSNSFEALSTTLKDNVMGFLANMTRPLFDNIKSTIKEANNWFDTHKIAAHELAFAIGDKLAAAWGVGVTQFKKWMPVVEQFAKDFSSRMLDTWHKMEPIIEKIARYIKDALVNSEQTFDKIENVLKAYVALKIGSELSPLLSGLAKLGAIPGLGGAGAAATALGPAAAVAAVGGAGILDMLTDPDNKYHDQANVELIGLKVEAEKLKESFGGLREAVDLLGGGMLTIAHEITGAFNDISDTIGDLFHPGRVLDPKEMERRGLKLHEDEPFAIERNMELHGRAFVAGILKGSAAPSKDPPHMPGTVIGKVEIVVNQTGDPERISRVLFDKMSGMTRFRRTSPYVNNYSAVGR